MTDSMLGLDSPDPSTEMQTAQRAAMEAQLKNGAGWFTSIAFLSIVNSVVQLSGAGWSFLIGLGMTQFVDAVGIAIATSNPESAMTAKIVAFVIDVGIAGLFALFGFFAKQRAAWAFVAGMVLYALDGVILLYFDMIAGALFHGFALFWLFRGMQAAQRLRATAAVPEAATSA
jgi:hypothetical protein